MQSDTGIFIHQLFKPCQGLDQDLFLSLTAIYPHGKRPTPSRHVQLGDTEGLESAVDLLLKANEAGWGAYIGLALRKRNFGRWHRGRKEDLALLPTLFADVDMPDPTMFRLLHFPLPPSCIVSSGKGYHLYWFLKTPTNDFDTADKLLHSLAQQFGSDEKMSVAQSMRLPGSKNTKPGRGGALCHIETLHPDWRYSLSEFTLCLPRQKPTVHHRHTHIPHEGRQALIQAVTQVVLNQLDGIPKRNGWIAARCPCPHCNDKPGMHFGFNPESGAGYCFGKHGKLSLDELCNLLGIRAS